RGAPAGRGVTNDRMLLVETTDRSHASLANVLVDRHNPARLSRRRCGALLLASNRGLTHPSIACAGVPDPQVKGGLDTLSTQKRALLENVLARRRQAAGRPTIARRQAEGPAPLSFPQQRIWFLEQWEP